MAVTLIICDNILYKISMYLLPVIYLGIFHYGFMKNFVMYYRAWKTLQKDRHIRSIAYLNAAIGIDALYSFICVFFLMVLDISKEYPILASPFLMILPNVVVLIALINFYHTTIHKEVK